MSSRASAALIDLVARSAMPECAAGRRRGRPCAAIAIETRGHIIAAARRVFTELGYHAATFGAIANLADVSRAAIEYHFGTKQGLWSEIVEETHALVFDAGLSWAARQTSLPSRLAAFLSVLTQAGSNDRSAAAFLVRSVLDAQRHPNLAVGEHESMTASRRFISWAVHDAIECDELITDIGVSDLVDMLCRVMWGMGLFTSFAAHRDDLPEVVHMFERLLANKLWRARESSPT